MAVLPDRLSLLLLSTCELTIMNLSAIWTAALHVVPPFFLRRRKKRKPAALLASPLQLPQIRMQSKRKPAARCFRIRCCFLCAYFLRIALYHIKKRIVRKFNFFLKSCCHSLYDLFLSMGIVMLFQISCEKLLRICPVHVHQCGHLFP